MPMGIHNTYLAIAADNGLPAASVFILIYLLIIAKSFVSFNNKMNLLGFGFFLSFIAILVMMTVDICQTFVFIWPMLWMMMGISLEQEWV